MLKRTLKCNDLFNNVAYWKFGCVVLSSLGFNFSTKYIYNLYNVYIEIIDYNLGH